MPQFLKNIGDLFSNKPTTYDPTKEAMFAQALAQSQQPAIPHDWGSSIGGLAQALLGSRGLKQQSKAKMTQETEAADLATQDKAARDASLAQLLSGTTGQPVDSMQASVLGENPSVMTEMMTRGRPAEPVEPQADPLQKPYSTPIQMSNADGTVQTVTTPLEAQQLAVQGFNPYEPAKEDGPSYTAPTRFQLPDGTTKTVQTRAEIQEILDGGGRIYEAPPPEEAAAGPDVQGETSLRKEFTSSSGTFEDVRNAYDRVQAATQDVSAAGDLALIFNYMKMLDPASVVRESEFATAASSGSVPERVWAQFNRVQRGERLSAPQRDDFVNQSGNLFEAASQRQDDLSQYYSELATQYGFDPSRVVREYGGQEFDVNQLSPDNPYLSMLTGGQ